MTRREWDQAKLFLREHVNGHHSVRDELRIGARVRLPDGPDRHRPTRGHEVWAVSVVRNEIDVVETAISHLLRQGVDHLLVMDHGSTDGTREVLQSLARQGHVHVAVDDGAGHYQKEKVRLLASRAARWGAAWVLPFDADELWFAHDELVADFLRRQTADVVAAEVTNMVPESALGPDTWFRAGPPGGSAAKVAFRAHRLVLLAQGNHGVARVGEQTSGLHVAHIPYRSPEQVRGKFAQGTRSLDESDAPAFEGWHWRQGLQLVGEDPAPLWGRLLDGQPIPELEWTGLGERTRCQLLHWSSWDPDGVLQPAAEGDSS